MQKRTREIYLQSQSGFVTQTRCFTAKLSALPNVFLVFHVIGPGKIQKFLTTLRMTTRDTVINLPCSLVLYWTLA